MADGGERRDWTEWAIQLVFVLLAVSAVIVGVYVSRAIGVLLLLAASVVGLLPAVLGIRRVFDDDDDDDDDEQDGR